MWFYQLKLLRLVTVSLIFEVLMVLVIGGCSNNQFNSEPRNPPPLAAVPVPQPPTQPHAKIVKASWYGPGLSGHVTATGERFNPNSMTAASTNLPLGSVVKVTNPENGRSVKVRINDCGPYVHGRSMDLSKRAAEKIGITHKGVAHLKVTPVEVPQDAQHCS
ncbi:MAG TPA: septal ring lytic transglycosylase RlpA family protein [Candidatus Binataceae bacterium]|nr:septal ring lytic transglycosylase RlpA family protein [Candidatus Binataceae bacterium]